MHVDAKFFFQFLTSILWAFGKLEKIPDPNGFTAITTNREKWRPLREELRRSNIDWLFCKYCKLRMYLASRALSLKSMAAAIARTRNTANKSLAHEAAKCDGFRNLVFLFFNSFFSPTRDSLTARCVDSRWQSDLKSDFRAKSRAISSASSYERNKIKWKQIVSSILKEGARSFCL